MGKAITGMIGDMSALSGFDLSKGDVGFEAVVPK